MKKIALLFGFLTLMICLSAQKKPTIPLPSPQQLAWHQLDYYWFIHFGPNTFTGNEWGHGDENDVFHPDSLDCRQWARLAKASGAKGIIITAKHHDGFCLWPSKYSKHTVRETTWRDGKGDVLKELKKACAEYGLKFGVYLSPWDRNHPKYGTAEYNDVYVNTMIELVKNYGPFFEFWWDGANGEGPNGKKQVYDFARFRKTMKTHAPNTIVFSDIGPQIRWVGNEKGIAGKTNWNTLDTVGFLPGLGAPPTDTLNAGNVNGKAYVPSECDVSIRPGWFYKKAENDKVKTPEQLFDLYLKSVGRGSNLLLNIPPGTDGLIQAPDSSSLAGFAELIKENFKTNLSLSAKGEVEYKMVIYPRKNFLDGKLATTETLPDYKQGSYWMRFPGESKLNTVILSEDLTKGQRIAEGKVILLNGTNNVKEISFTTIGKKRILTFPTESVTAIQVQITAAKAAPWITEIATYLIDDTLIER